MSKDLVKADEKAVAVAPKPAPVVPSGAWLSPLKGDVWVDASGKEHAIVGVVTEGFDSICDGKPENHRQWAVAKNEEGKDVKVVDDGKISAVNAWKRKGA